MIDIEFDVGRESKVILSKDSVFVPPLVFKVMIFKERLADETVVTILRLSDKDRGEFL